MQRLCVKTLVHSRISIVLRSVTPRLIIFSERGIKNAYSVCNMHVNHIFNNTGSVIVANKVFHVVFNLKSELWPPVKPLWTTVARTNLSHRGIRHPFKYTPCFWCFVDSSVSFMPLKPKIKLQNIELHGWIAGTRGKHALAWVENHRTTPFGNDSNKQCGLEIKSRTR